MKFSISICCSIILFAFASCKKESAVFDENLIAINQCRSFTRDAISLTCCLDSVIEDSRCPIDAVCIWQGRGVARFKVNTQNTVHTITLATIKFTPFNKDTTLAGFKIELIGLSPYPDLKKPLRYKDYVAEVKITKL